MTKSLLTGIALMVLLSACGPPAPTVRPDPRTDPAEQRIEAMADRGELDEAARAWLALAEERPEQAATMRLRAADLFLQNEDFSNAGQILDMVEREALRGTQIHHYDLARPNWPCCKAIWPLPAGSWPAWPTPCPDLASRHALLESACASNWNSRPRRPSPLSSNRSYAATSSPSWRWRLLIDQPLSDLEQLLLPRPPTRTAAVAGTAGQRAPVPARSARAGSAHDALGRASPDHTGYAPSRPAVADRLAPEPALHRKSWRAPARSRLMNRVSAAVREGLVSAWMGLPPDRRPELIFQYIEDDADAVIAAWFELREPASISSSGRWSAIRSTP
jgi:hypothetical protein